MFWGIVTDLSPNIPADRCLWSFGAANDVTVIYDPDQDLVVRVPTDRLVVERPCAGA